MVERQEVEALLEYVEMRLQSDKVELPPTVSDDTLAALCRAWLALDDAPKVTLEWGDFSRGLFIDDPRMTAFDWEQRLTGQRVRIVKEVGDD